VGLLVYGFDLQVGDEEDTGFVVRMLREKSFKAIERAKRNLKYDDFDGAVFNAQQHVELYLKSVVVEYSGLTPRTHSLRKLLATVGKIFGRENEVSKFIRDNRFKLRVLEDAYFQSRYGFTEYSREEAEELVKFAEEIVEFAKNIMSARKGGGL